MNYNAINALCKHFFEILLLIFKNTHAENGFLEPYSSSSFNDLKNLHTCFHSHYIILCLCIKVVGCLHPKMHIHHCF